jgi:hypothetical protein
MKIGENKLYLNISMGVGNAFGSSISDCKRIRDFPTNRSKVMG